MLIRSIGATSLLVLLAACSGTLQGAKRDMGFAPPPPPHVATPSNYNRHPVPTTAEEDQTALDRADQRAEEQANRAKQRRHEAAERVMRAKAGRTSDHFSQAQIVEQLTRDGYSNVGLSKVTDVISDHTVYSGSAMKDGAMKTFTVDDRAQVSDVR